MTNTSPLPRDVAELAHTARFFKHLVIAALVLITLAALTFAVIKLDQRRHARHERLAACLEYPWRFADPLDVGDPDVLAAGIAECERRYK